MKSTEKTSTPWFDCIPQNKLSLKCSLALLEHPFFTISQNIKVKNTKVSEDPEIPSYIYPEKPAYIYGKYFINITPKSSGAPKLADKEVIIFLASHLIRGIDDKKTVSQNIRFVRAELMQIMHRGKSGAAYNALDDALKRLHDTKFETNIATSEGQKIESFSLIEITNPKSPSNSKSGKDWIEVKICDWLYNQFTVKGIITLDDKYSTIRKPIERRIYELSHKHCGDKPWWKIGIGKLHTKSGSTAALKEFARSIRNIRNDDSFDLYHLSLEKSRRAEGDCWVYVKNKKRL